VPAPTLVTPLKQFASVQHCLSEDMLEIDGLPKKMSVKEGSIKWRINGFSRAKRTITATAQLTVVVNLTSRAPMATVSPRSLATSWKAILTISRLQD
jgi:hypothetical protein